MARKHWFSLSLAHKCQLEFALAVLLIIGAGLFIPYRWMDKLIAQSKLELAKTEVAHVLERHFPADDKAGQLESVLEAVGQSGSAGGGLQEARPVTRWVRLGKDDSLASDDSFLVNGIKEFREDNSKQEIFKLGRLTSELDIAESKDPDAVPTESGRYLYAIRGSDKCIACHRSQAVESVAVDAHKPAGFTEGELVGVVSVVLPAGQTGTLLLFNRIFIVAGGVLSCICAMVVFYIIMQRIILKPVRSLRESADMVEAQGFATLPESAEKDGKDKKTWMEALAVMDKIKTGDEFEELADAFHQMLTRLKLAHDRLGETNRALDLRLGELEARNIALHESNRLKSEFLANISHELRTPLNSIIGFAEVLLEQAAQREDDKAVRYCSNVLESGNLLLININDLLELARIEAGKVEVRREQFSFREVADSLLNVTRLQVQAKQLKVNLFIDDDVDMIETDAGKLQQILFNLFSNAIKFTPANGQIDIAAGMAGGEGQEPMLQITITDTGPGIAVEDREKIFEKFRQLDGSVTREHSGVGLGLAIVRELLDILGGTIRVSGESDRGAVFTVLLPIGDKRSKGV